MAQPQQNITIAAPGFQGLNTEESPLEQNPGFGTITDNAVVDKSGRIAAREAFATKTVTDAIPYSTAPGMVTEEKDLKRIASGVIDGQLHILAIMSHWQYDVNGALLQEDYYIVEVDDDALGSITYPAVLIPANLRDAKIIPFNNKMYIYSKGNEPLVFDGTTITKLSATAGYIAPQDDTGTIAAELNGDVATAAYGRMWVSGVNGDYNTIYYSDLLIGHQWYDGKAVPTDPLNTAGILDVAEYWPLGGDRIVAIQAHNNFLIVFGRSSILLYANAAVGDPAAEGGIFLQDTIENVGCINRDAITSIGSDIIFVDDSGVRSLGRTIQEKSVPIGDLSVNVRSDIQQAILVEPNKDISLFYVPDKGMLVCLFSDTEQAYVFDMKQPSASGGNKVTRWTDCVFNRGIFIEDGDTAYTLLAGRHGTGALVYGGYSQYDGQPYLFKYESNLFTFGDSVRQKFLKQVDFTIISTFINAEATVKWGYGGSLQYSSNKTIVATPPALFGVAEYNVGTFGLGLDTIKRYRTNTKGSGATVAVGFEAEINGNSCSIQEINIQTLLGRIY